MYVYVHADPNYVINFYQNSSTAYLMQIEILHQIS